MRTAAARTSEALIMPPTLPPASREHQEESVDTTILLCDWIRAPCGGDKSGRWSEWYRKAIPAAEAANEAYLKGQR
jgi:hypothetical protein